MLDAKPSSFQMKGIKMTDVSSYKLRIRQISTGWKDNSENFPMVRRPSTVSLRTGRVDRKNSEIVSASIQIESFKVRKVGDMVNFNSNPMLDAQDSIYSLVSSGF